MSLLNKTNPNLDGVKLNCSVNGLGSFAHTLEKDFFAEAEIQSQCYPNSKKVDLILDLYCNFGITESLHYFNSGNWGGFKSVEGDLRTESSLFSAFSELNRINDNDLDIAETSLHFKDTSIVISKLDHYSIVDQMGLVLSKISEHFVHYTKGLTEMPYEIYIPVFEEKKLTVSDFKKMVQDGYFNYWGLYFEDCKEHSVMVYDLNKKELFKENLFLLE